jgi:hypothetical protein
MFNNSKIDNSDLTNSEPMINYDASQIKKEGYKLKYAIDSKNPIYSQVINECKVQQLLYKIIPIKNNQKHIWIKES